MGGDSKTEDVIHHPEHAPLRVIVDRLPRARAHAWLDDFPLVMNTTHPGHYAAIALEILGHAGWFHPIWRDGKEMFKPARIDWAARHFADPANSTFVELKPEQYAEHRARVQKYLSDPDATTMDEEG